MSLRQRFESGITATKDDLRRMSVLVVTSLGIAEQAVASPDTEARVRVREVEHRIDGMEVAIEQRCHELMLLEAPVAGDLRLLISAMRIATDLEHIGDLAQSVAKRFSAVAMNPHIVLPEALRPLAALPTSMLSRAMDAFASGDLSQVEAIGIDEKRSDALAKTCALALQVSMEARPGEVRELTQVLRAVYHWEQAADLCVCIAEEAVFFHSGKVIRHQPGTGRFEPS